MSFALWEKSQLAAARKTLRDPKYWVVGMTKEQAREIVKRLGKKYRKRRSSKKRSRP